MAAPPPQSQPPALMDELVEEILLRLPANRPAQLVHAAMVCKHWCRLVTDPGFRRRFHQFHRTAPMLGLIIGRRGSHAAVFLPTSSSFHPCDAVCRNWSPMDARHGRVLFCCNPNNIPTRDEIKVWTPATGEVRKLPKLCLPCALHANWNAALLCATPGCNHMECPSDGPFKVVLVGGKLFEERFIHAYVYSSETDEWSHPTCIIGSSSYVENHCAYSALVGNALYFPLEYKEGILEYDLAKKELSVIRLPPICDLTTVHVLMSVGDDGLGFAMVNDDYFLRIWLRESAPTPSGWVWMQHRVVDLKSFFPVSVLPFSPYIVAAADAVSVFLIRVRYKSGVWAINLKYGRVSKISDANGYIYDIIPYISFCTPALRAAAIDEGPSMGSSSNT